MTAHVSPVPADDPRLRPLLTAYHLRTEEEKGVPVSGPAELPPAYRAEIEHPAESFAGATVLLATVPGEAEAAGCAVLRTPAAAPAELKRLWTAPGHRGKGVGAALMAKATALATEAGAPALRLSVWSWREPALRLYEREGFCRVPSWEARPDLVCLERALG
ncbi:GNAT family N-acetyltransferase [Streptomyces sp. SPB074]|uniref:GNAT family N-acetyltransferase n=1 Tax=Streptomyces sp. (strain SPB074) TaxID=465543 RepID=UPI00017F19C8|nr:GNAT family N-acetyltransferase [Streptomyces sp. SPB074]EDY45844.2 GNAT family acetyltransferase [Streptomyces sp. SPB074]